MRILFALFLSLSCHFGLLGQLSIQDRLNSSITEAENYLSLYESSRSGGGYDCPPKIAKNSSSLDSSLNFLLLLDDNFENEKRIYLSKMMEKDCSAYYTLRTLDAHYSPIYKKILEEYDIPDAYALLPLAISASNPYLNIEGDRAGIWQLNFINARRFGLRIDESIDDRYDITRSTLAAIQYILFLEEYFKGNKLLTLSAFYSSVPYVNKLRSALKQYSDEAFLMALNQDVLHFLIYYYSWHEWNRIFKDVKLTDPIAKVEKNQKALIVEDSVSIDILSMFLGLENNFVRSLNPMWVGKWLTAESKEYSFLLPKEKADFISDHYDGFLKFQNEKLQKENDELLALKKRIKEDIPDPKRYTAITYKVKSGDVLGLIAQRYGVKVSSIKKWNKLSSDRINIGQQLILYVPKSKQSDVKEEESEDDEALVETEIKVENKKPNPGKGTYTSYVVKQGESLWLIARKFPGVSAENIMEWNGISDKIKPGQEIKIYKGE